jgi:hypothetical protein
MMKAVVVLVVTSSHHPRLPPFPFVMSCVSDCQTVASFNFCCPLKTHITKKKSEDTKIKKRTKNFDDFFFFVFFFSPVEF